MATVNVRPLEDFYRRFPMRLRPFPPPIFPDGPPTDQDVALARELFAELDDESRAWYRRNMPTLFAGLG